MLEFRRFDVLLSALNDSTRVRVTHAKLSARRKVWLVHEEYGYTSAELPAGETFVFQSGISEIEQWVDAVATLGIDFTQQSVAIDITGMMRPSVLVLPTVLKLLGAVTVTVIYSDPDLYAQGSGTTFAKGDIREIGVVPGLGGASSVEADLREALIIGAGYDHQLIRALAESRRAADHVIMVGLPGLQPHMYQEALYRISLVGESIRGFGRSSILYAPASDPFVTAQVLSGEVERRSQRGPVSMQLASVGTKAQVLGFGWFYLVEGRARGANVLFPYSEQYARETSTGLGTIHLYELELEMAPAALDD